MFKKNKVDNITVKLFGNDNGSPMKAINSKLVIQKNKEQKKESPTTQILYMKANDKCESETEILDEKCDTVKDHKNKNAAEVAPIVNEFSTQIAQPSAEIHEIVFKSSNALKNAENLNAIASELHKDNIVKVKSKNTPQKKCVKKSKVNTKKMPTEKVGYFQKPIELATSAKHSVGYIDSEILTLQKVTKELEDIVNIFQHDLPESPNNKTQTDHTSPPTIQFQKRQYFKFSKNESLASASHLKISDEKNAEPPIVSTTDDTLTASDNILDTLKFEVFKALKDKKTFTICGPLTHPVRQALLARGWVEKFHKTYSSYVSEDVKDLFKYTVDELLPLLKDKKFANICTSLIKSKLLQEQQVDFYWGINRIDTIKENSDKTKLTTINKLIKDVFNISDTSKLSHWYQESDVSKLNHPRSYSIGKHSDLKDFIDDFHNTAAMSVLKWVVKTNIKKESKVISQFGKIPLEVFDFALNECCKFIKKYKQEDVDEIIPHASEYEWNQFLTYFYELVHCSNHFKSEGKENEESLVTKSSYILDNIRKFDPYLDMDGIMNIWLLKAGLGPQKKEVHRNLQQILNVAKQSSNTTYVVQKYIERPLLIHKIKFDIKVWFLISSCFPLTIWIHKDCYLQFSQQTYNVRKLPEASPARYNSLKYKEQNMDDDALPIDEIWDHKEFQNYLINIGYPEAFSQITYPAIKQGLSNTIQMQKHKITVRRNCFELRLADFILTEDFKPWLLKTSPCSETNDSNKLLLQLYDKVLEDVVKVIIDSANSSKADTGGFELLYREKLIKMPSSNKALKAPLPGNYLPNIPAHKLKHPVKLAKKESFRQFGERIKTTLKSLLQIIQYEKEKRRLKH